MRFFPIAVNAFAILTLISGCAPRSANPPTSSPHASNVVPSEEALRQGANLQLTSDYADCSSPGLLHTLWEQRNEQGKSYGFPIGPGDVLHIQIADLKEFEHLSVRVDGDGTIDLPLIGNMRVAGMNEDQVREAISNRASDYVLNPRVHVFISQYHSRSIAVMGMVAKPGAYSLSGPTDTLLDTIGRAGGMREGAAQRVVFFPAETNSDAAANGTPSSQGVECAEGLSTSGEPSQRGHSCPAVSAGLTDSKLNVDASKPIPGASDAIASPVVIDLTKPALAGCLSIPARPGDVVLVPAAGQVGVYGWVQKPGTFDVTPGMTVLGAVTAAGGAAFSSKAEILITGPDGQRTVVPIDLSRVEDGEEPDVPVQAGDLVLVRASALGAVPYAFFTLLNKFGTGMYLAAP